MNFIKRLYARFKHGHLGLYKEQDTVWTKEGFMNEKFFYGAVDFPIEEMYSS